VVCLSEGDIGGEGINGDSPACHSVSRGRKGCAMTAERRMVRNNGGFTYLAVVVMVIITGLSLGAFGLSWHTMMKREREEELLFRGRQIRDAITHWYTPRGSEHAATPLNDLKDLLQDPRSPQTVRYLRRLYTDPITNKEWVVIRDPAKGILGVASSSQDVPLKTGGFPDDLQDFVGKMRYSDWRFLYSPSGSTATQQGTTVIPRASNPLQGPSPRGIPATTPSFPAAPGTTPQSAPGTGNSP